MNLEELNKVIKECQDIEKMRLTLIASASYIEVLQNYVLRVYNDFPKPIKSSMDCKLFFQCYEYAKLCKHHVGDNLRCNMCDSGCQNIYAQIEACKKFLEENDK